MSRHGFTNMCSDTMHGQFSVVNSHNLVNSVDYSVDSLCGLKSHSRPKAKPKAIGEKGDKNSITLLESV